MVQLASVNGQSFLLTLTPQGRLMGKNSPFYNNGGGEAP